LYNVSKYYRDNAAPLVVDIAKSDFAYCDRCYRSVTWSVVRALCSNGRRYPHDFFCIWQPQASPRSR